MWQQLLPGLRITIFFTVLCGLAYPLAITGICQLVFPHQANGSLITAEWKVVGSELIGAELHQARVLPAAPVGGRQRLRSDRFRRLELRPDQQEADRPREGLG